MKTTIELPEELLRQVKAAAELRGQTTNQYLTELLERELSRLACSRSDEAVRKQQAASLIEELESLAGRIGEKWTGSFDAVDVVGEQRRG